MEKFCLVKLKMANFVIGLINCYLPVSSLLRLRRSATSSGTSLGAAVGFNELEAEDWVFCVLNKVVFGNVARFLIFGVDFEVISV